MQRNVDTVTSVKQLLKRELRRAKVAMSESTAAQQVHALPAHPANTKTARANPHAKNATSIPTSTNKGNPPKQIATHAATNARRGQFKVRPKPRPASANAHCFTTTQSKIPALLAQLEPIAHVPMALF